ncbi:hypothetical protein Tco_0886325, partial [Tanacetum coccineum]
FQVTPKTSHLLAVKRIFRYLKGKPTLGLWYSRDSPFELVAYTDSDYAGETQDRLSTTGGCQFLGNRLISWQCKKQTVVATSITKAEYVKHVEYLMLNASPFEVMFEKEDNGLGSQYDMGTKVATVSNSYLLKHCLRGGISKEVGTPRYLSLVVPLTKVGDEAVHKELGDRMERAATTASSLEAEQDSGSGPRCQDTILGDVNAQTRFEITSKQSIDPPLSRGYTLGSGEDSMTLIGIDGILMQTLSMVNVSYKLVDKKRVIIMESSIRSDLHLADASGMIVFQTDTSFDECKDGPPITTQHMLSRPRRKQSRRKQRKETEVPPDETHHDDSVPIPSNDPLLSEKVNDAQAKEIAGFKEEESKVRRDKRNQEYKVKSLRKEVESSRVESSEDKESCCSAGGKKQEKRVKIDERECILTIVIDELNLAQTLIEIKAAKPKDVTTAATTTTTRPKTKDKGKAIMIKHEVHLKRKDQVSLDEEMARNLKA